LVVQSYLLSSHPLGVPEVLAVKSPVMVPAGCGLGGLVILEVRIPRSISHRPMVRHIITLTTMLAVRIMVDLMAADTTAVDLTEAAVVGIIDFVMSRLPNNSPEPNPIAAFGNARTPGVHLVAGSGWLSFCR